MYLFIDQGLNSKNKKNVFLQKTGAEQKFLHFKVNLYSINEEIRLTGPFSPEKVRFFDKKPKS